MARQSSTGRPAARRRAEPDIEAEAPVPAPVASVAAPSGHFVLALDVGYSNLKLLAGPPGEPPSVTVLPAGAGPASALPLRVGAAPGRQDGLAVEVGGVAWAAGVEPSRLRTVPRELHPDYPASPGYLALVHAALLAAGRAHVDLLVTGLPVSQWMDAARRAAVQRLIEGIHQVTAAQRVAVASVDVLAQPIGAYLDLDAAEPATLSQSRVLVVDAGFFSVDWALFDEGDMRAASSGTSTEAMSVVLDATGELIRRDHGSRIGRDLLERALRGGAAAVPLFGRPVELAPYLAEAARQTTHVALTAVLQSLRGEEREVDLVLLAGGGAATYEPAARELFPRARVKVPDAPVLANVRGYWRQACRLAG